MTGGRPQWKSKHRPAFLLTALERNLFAIDANLAQRKTRPYTEFWSIFFGFPKGRKKLILQGEKGPYSGLSLPGK
jgi:hypothetical protein